MLHLSLCFWNEVALSTFTDATRNLEISDLNCCEEAFEIVGHLIVFPPLTCIPCMSLAGKI